MSLLSFLQSIKFSYILHGKKKKILLQKSKCLKGNLFLPFIQLTEFPTIWMSSELFPLPCPKS